MKIHKIETGNFKIDGGAIFGVVPKTIWNKMYVCDENNLMNLCMRSLLIDEGERKILIDTGIGEKQDESFLRHYYLNGNDTLEKSLHQAGYSYDEITDVILTHLHFDHVGGAVKYNKDKTYLVSTFPNATYHVSFDQWEWALNPNNREKASYLEENFLPLQKAGQIRLLEAEEMLTDNISLRFFHGHTAGLIVPIIEYQEKSIAYVTDLIPVRGNLKVNYVSAFDIEPLTAMDEKEDFLNEAYDNDYILFFQHDIEHECCKVEKSEKGFKPGASFRFESCFGLG